MDEQTLKQAREVFAQADRDPAERREAALCFAYTIYYEGDVLSNAEGIRHFYATALPFLRERITSHDTDARMRFKKINKRAFELLDAWLAAADPKRDHYGLIFESGPRVQDVSDGAFHFYHSGTLYPGLLRLALPVEMALESPRRMVDLGLELTSKLKVITGYAGICLATYMYAAWQEGRPLYVLSRRYLGVDFADPYRFREYQRFGINAANWLTWVGDRWMEKLGGRDALAGAASPPLVVHPLPSGVVVQAGDAPALGDTNRGEPLEAYHAAGRLLRPVRLPAEKLGKDGPIGGNDNTRSWLQRFD
jgi:hypothetical protein